MQNDKCRRNLRKENESKEKKNVLEMKNHLPNPMTFTHRRMTTNCVVLIRNPNDQNDVKR